MKAYIYKNKINGKKVYSNEPINDSSLILISSVKNVIIKNNEVIQK